MTVLKVQKIYREKNEIAKKCTKCWLRIGQFITTKKIIIATNEKTVAIQLESAEEVVNQLVSRILKKSSICCSHNNSHHY